MSETQIWILVSAAAVVVINNLVLWLWKPWTEAYAGEKGKNLARKEDLDKILEEVHAVTQMQKEIEAKISGDAWDTAMAAEPTERCIRCTRLGAQRLRNRSR
jgi:membrane protein implicated in regulation of membrane protease activity